MAYGLYPWRFQKIKVFSSWKKRKRKRKERELSYVFPHLYLHRLGVKLLGVWFLMNHDLMSAKIQTNLGGLLSFPVLNSTLRPLDAFHFVKSSATASGHTTNKFVASKLFQ